MSMQIKQDDKMYEDKKDITNTDFCVGGSGSNQYSGTCACHQQGQHNNGAIKEHDTADGNGKRKQNQSIRENQRNECMRQIYQSN